MYNQKTASVQDSAFQIQWEKIRTNHLPITSEATAAAIRKAENVNSKPAFVNTSHIPEKAVN
jgi:hypothetical protein